MATLRWIWSPADHKHKRRNASEDSLTIRTFSCHQAHFRHWCRTMMTARNHMLRRLAKVTLASCATNDRPIGMRIKRTPIRLRMLDRIREGEDCNEMILYNKKLVNNKFLQTTFKGWTLASLRWRSSRHIGPPIRRAKYAPLWIHSTSSRPYIRRFARKFFVALYFFLLIIGAWRKLIFNFLLSSTPATSRCDRDCGCEQKYKWHRLLAYDPDNDCKGIFMDWFLFPSCCVCRCKP